MPRRPVGDARSPLTRHTRSSSAALRASANRKSQISDFKLNIPASHPLRCGRHWIRTGFPRRLAERHLTSSVVVVCVGSWSLSPGWCGRRVSYSSAWRSQEGRIFLPSDPRRGAVAGPCGPLRVLAASGCWVVAAPTLAAGDPGATVAPQLTRPSVIRPAWNRLPGGCYRGTSTNSAEPQPGPPSPSSVIPLFAAGCGGLAKKRVGPLASLAAMP